MALQDILTEFSQGNSVDSIQNFPYNPRQDPKARVVSLRSSRRAKTFNGTHEWRRNERPALVARREKNDGAISRERRKTRKHLTAPGQESVATEPTEPKNTAPIHTNEILEYFGFRDGSERADLLRSFNGDYHDGADTIRHAYRLSQSFDLKGNYYETPQQTRDLFISIANSIFKNGDEATKLLLKSFGLENISEILKMNLVPLDVGSKVHLVTRKDLETIASSVPEGSGIHPTLLANLGYQLQVVGGLPVYIR